jgi:predicted CXXCH cytochrome family protein
MTTRRRTFLFVAGALALAVVLVPGLAFANAGVHGNYAMDTDQCAGCHRAHTAPSSATWVDSNNRENSALLLGSYSELYQFCLTCHGDSAMGADTNVEGGVLQSRVNSPSPYGTPNAALISGPFGVQIADSTGVSYPRNFEGKLVTSKHDFVGGSWGAYGGGVYGLTAMQTPAYDGSVLPSIGAGASLVKMDCGTCHDVHGSSNYRMLKNQVYGVTVGGYDGSGDPIPYVESNEDGFPTGGFLLHQNYAATYKPDYTTAYYKKPADPDKGMSGWCVGCHTYYMGKRANTGRGASIETTYLADSFFGNVLRHRHPVNVPLSNFAGPGGTPTPDAVLAPNSKLPLAHADRTDALAAVTGDDWVDCLTCHYAHGTTAIMTGYANVADPKHQVLNSGSGGVAPTDDSALLRQNNRYACEACHEK